MMITFGRQVWCGQCRPWCLPTTPCTRLTSWWWWWLWGWGWMWWWWWWCQHTLLNWESMDEDVVPPVPSHLLNLSVHLKHLHIVIIIIIICDYDYNHHHHHHDYYCHHHHHHYLLHLSQCPSQTPLSHRDNQTFFIFIIINNIITIIVVKIVIMIYDLASNVLDLSSETCNLSNRIGDFSSGQVLNNLVFKVLNNLGLKVFNNLICCVSSFWLILDGPILFSISSLF